VFTLFVIGGKAERDYAAHCMNLCIKLGVEDRVVFLGPRSDLPDLLQIADFAVMSSRSESGPLVLIEYMAFGLPFVSTQVGDVSNRAERLGMLEFVPPDDPAAMASAMQRLLDLSSAERIRRGEQGREVVRQHFDLRKAMPRWYRLYHATSHTR
jgi:glycosyltransferase involved in cell wall biosynthesis